MIVMNALTGKLLATLPIGVGVDGATFNAATRLLSNPAKRSYTPACT